MSKLADYGTVVMTTMAREPERVHSAAGLAADIGLAQPTVSKVLKTLSAKGLVISSRGVKGGYRLAGLPAEISVAAIIDAMDGPISVTECSSAPGLCTREASCAVRANWQAINGIVRQVLQRVTLEQMMRSAPTAPPRSAKVAQ